MYVRRLQPRRHAHRHGVSGQDRAHLGRRDRQGDHASCAATKTLCMSAAFSPDGTRIVTASWDKTARIWDAATGKEITVLRGHESQVCSAAFSPDGTRIVTASDGQDRAHLGRRDRQGNHGPARARGRRAVRRLQPRRHAHRHGVRRQDRAHLGRRDAARKSRSCAGTRDVVQSAAFSPDGTRIVTASWDKTARIWDAVTGKEITVLRGHEAR